MKYRLLLVEDDPLLREVLDMELSETMGCEVLTAGGVREAIEILGRGGIDLVLSDIMMLDGTGIEIVDWVRAQEGNRPPVILMTGLLEDRLPRFRENGVAALVTKPFDGTKLANTIRETLRAS
ncbi:MAG: response regulator [Bdellovibrionota bacterium]